MQRFRRVGFNLKRFHFKSIQRVEVKGFMTASTEVNLNHVHSFAAVVFSVNVILEFGTCWEPDAVDNRKFVFNSQVIGFVFDFGNSSQQNWLITLLFCQTNFVVPFHAVHISFKLHDPLEAVCRIFETKIPGTFWKQVFFQRARVDRFNKPRNQPKLSVVGVNLGFRFATPTL